MNPEYDHEAQMALWRAKDAKEDAANPAPAERNYTEELRQLPNNQKQIQEAAHNLDRAIQRNSGLDTQASVNPQDVYERFQKGSLAHFNSLGQDFRDENILADMARGGVNYLNSRSEYQVDPLDMDEKSQHEKWAEEDEKDATLLHNHGNWLSTKDIGRKVDLYQTDPFDPPEMPPEPPAGLTGWDAIGAEIGGTWEEGEANMLTGARDPGAETEGERVQPTPLASETNPYGRPNVSFESDGYLHEYYRDGRRVKTPIGKPGTGVSPAADLRPGTN